MAFCVFDEVLWSLFIVRLTFFFNIDHNAFPSAVQAGSVIVSETMLMSPNKDETAVHGSHCRGDMAVRMRKVLAIPRSW